MSKQELNQMGIFIAQHSLPIEKNLEGIPMKSLLATQLLHCQAAGLCSSVIAQGGPEQDKIIDGKRYPDESRQ